MRFAPRYWMFALLFVAMFAGPSRAASLTVRLLSGRTFTGEVDSRSGAEQLLLRFSSSGAEIVRPIAWDRIAAATEGDRTVTVAELRQRVIAESSKRNSQHKPHVIEIKGTSASDPFVDEAAAPEPWSSAQGPVRSLAIDAHLANWDADAESDGLAVTVWPLNARGEVVAAQGTLHVEWIGPQLRDFHQAPRSRGIVIHQLGHWTFRLSPSDLGPRGNTFHAEFGAKHPEFDLDLLSRGLVQAQLAVPGEGVFAARVDGIRVRAWSPTRDLMQHFGSSR